MVKLGLFCGIRVSAGKFREEQSRMNWVRTMWLVPDRSQLVGLCVARVLSISGRILSRVSEVALQSTTRWTRSSVGAGWSE